MSHEGLPERRVARPDLAQRVQAGLDEILGDQRRVSRGVLDSREHCPFDLAAYERVVGAQCRELTPDDLPAIGELYQSAEIDPDVFATLAGGEEAAAEEMLRTRGGMVDRWHSSDTEIAAMRQLVPSYVTSKDEYRTFLDGTHERPDDFRNIGLFDQGQLIALAAGWMPPREPDRLGLHSKRYKAFFDGSSAPKVWFSFEHHSIADKGRYVENLPGLMEFYLILQRCPGAATVVFNDFMEMVRREYPAVTDIGVSRFGTMRMLQPNNSCHATDGENSRSRQFFREGLGFRTIGTWTDYSLVAARETRDGQIVVVRPDWKYMRPKDGIASVFQASKENREALDATARRHRRTV